MIRGIVTGEPVQGKWGWRPLFMVTLSIVIFGLSMERLGLVPALLLLFTVAALGGREFRLKEVLLLAVLMSVFAALVFVYGLKLPYPLFGPY
jgi:putative tricarboxylic transport membrane protein